MDSKSTIISSHRFSRELQWWADSKFLRELAQDTPVLRNVDLISPLSSQTVRGITSQHIPVNSSALAGLEEIQSPVLFFAAFPSTFKSLDRVPQIGLVNPNEEMLLSFHRWFQCLNLFTTFLHTTLSCHALLFKSATAECSTFQSRIVSSG